MGTGEGSPLVGRTAELELLLAFARGEARARTVVLEGEAGIGKTALWEAAVDAGRAAGAIVLSARAAQAEASLSLAVAADLLAGVPPEVAAALPGPQRRAVDRVLLLAELDASEPLDRRAVGTALLSSLRLLAARSRVVVALDDLQWTDEASALALGYALRRLADEPVVLLATRRTGEAAHSGLPLPEPSELLELGPLSLGATRRLLAQRDLPLSRRAAGRIHTAAGGNPFFTLELAHALTVAGGRLDRGAELPVTRTLDELVGDRVAALASDVRTAVLVVASTGSATAALVAEAGGAV